MNIFRGISLFPLTALIFLLLGTVLFFAFHENNPPGTTPTVKRPEKETGRSTPLSSPGAQDGAAAQLPTQGWAERLEQSGIRVGWDEKTGTPFFLRAKGLGVRPLDGRTGRSVFEGGYGDRALAVMQNLAPAFGIRDAQAELKPAGKEETDELGFRHQRLGQIYAGLPVVGGDLKVHFDAQGIPYEVSGRFVPGIEVDTRPAISAVESEESARQAFAGEASSLEGLQVHEPATLVVLAVDQAPVLAYQLAVSSTPANSSRYWVDAKTGQVIRRVSQVCSIQAPTSRGAAVPLRGMRLPSEGAAYTSFPGWRENGVYYMNDPSSYTYVFNCNNTTSTTNNLANTTNDYGTFAFRPGIDWSSSDPAAVSVAANMVTILSYYKKIHNRRSADGQGTVVPAYVHYDEGFDNAFYSFSDKAMFYGDGGDLFYPLGVLDVAAHELTHAVTRFSADLEYLNESGALNESFSDIFGVTIEFYGQNDMSHLYPGVMPGAADWLIGEDCTRLAPALRDMRSPTNTNTTVSPQPSRYRGTRWFDYTKSSRDEGGVHNNSGVQNHFYYLLCQGGKGTNDGIVYNLTGIGINNARQIAYRALTVYCTKNTTYAGARAAWFSAATDLNSAWASPVAAAWDAVGVAGSGSSTGGGGENAGFSAATDLGSVRFFNATVGGSKITGSGQSFWWTWTAPVTGRLQLDTSRSAPGADTQLLVYNYTNRTATNSSGTVTTSSTLGALVSSNDNAPSVLWSKLDFGVKKGDRLALEVRGMKAGQNLLLSGILAAQDIPANDLFSSASVQTGTRWTVRGSNFNGSAESGEPAHAKSAAAQSVWFSWTAPANRTFTLSTAGSSADTVLAVYTGSTVNRLTQVTANDDASKTVKTSEVRFGANAGTTYRIALDSKNGQNGPYVLELR